MIRVFPFLENSEWKVLIKTPQGSDTVWFPVHLSFVRLSLSLNSFSTSAVVYSMFCFIILKKAEDAFAWKWKTCKHFSVRCLQWLPRASWFKFMSSESKQTLQKHTWIFISFTADVQLSNCRNIKSKTTLLHFVNSSEAKTFVSKKTRRSGRQPLGQCDSFSCLHTSRSWTHSISNLSSVLMFLCYRICCGIRIYLCVLGENYETRSPALLVFSEAAPDRWL